MAPHATTPAFGVRQRQRCPNRRLPPTTHPFFPLSRPCTWMSSLNMGAIPDGRARLGRRCLGALVAVVLAGIVLVALYAVGVARRRVCLDSVTTPSALAVLGINDVAALPGGTLRALAHRTRVPLLVRFDVPKPWDHDAAAWSRTFQWDRQPFSEAEVRHMWRCYNRDGWGGGRQHPLAQADGNSDKSVDDDIGAMWARVRAHVMDRARAAGVDDGAWCQKPVAFSHYVARRWLAAHPALADLAPVLDLESAPHRAYVDVKVWFNSAGYCTGAHYDPLNNLSVNACGRKRWLLAAPRDHDCFYPTERVETTGVQRYRVRNHYVDATAIDPTTGGLLYPRLADARMIEVDVMPGHVLVVPRRWIHFVATVEPSVSFTINMPTGAG
ncbi:Cupin incomplete domain containing protein [Pandoravirus salinus]|uniref:Cupin incomplete domain containing protein n=1 Tax=Pandoravirus salinus TaxID=1349410 RepID=S4VXN4_9VIRU|nr:Cupin incomplete domain [Pandoravirus salinus]AGO84221.2 Cupin incomplete domain containing protein [Pandoravirus salinus]